MIFVHNYRRKKQTFVKVIWLLVSLTEIILAVIYFYLTPLEENNRLSEEEQHRVDVSQKTLKFLNQILLQASIWVFANEYLRLALKFPLMLCQLDEEEVKARKRRNWHILVGVNLYFSV